MSDIVGIGIDVVGVVRFSELMARRPRIGERLFTLTEREYAARLHDPAPALAARFAAKEAAMKALGVGLGSVRFAELEVRRATTGAPSLHLSGRAAALAAERGVSGWHISLTHTAEVASAIVAAVTSN